MKLIMRIISILVLVCSFTGVSFAADEHDQALIERIQAVGQVCKAGTNCANVGASQAVAAQVVAQSGSAAAGRSGADIAAKHCAMCHGTPGIPGAPNSAETWKPRVDAKGIDGLTASAMSGINAMPPKGMCMDCSEAELKAAIEALLK